MHQSGPCFFMLGVVSLGGKQTSGSPNKHTDRQNTQRCENIGLQIGENIILQIGIGISLRCICLIGKRSIVRVRNLQAVLKIRHGKHAKHVAAKQKQKSNQKKYFFKKTHTFYRVILLTMSIKVYPLAATTMAIREYAMMVLAFFTFVSSPYEITNKIPP